MDVKAEPAYPGSPTTEILDTFSAVAESVPEKALDINMRAFELGRSAAREHLCTLVKCRD